MPSFSAPDAIRRRLAVAAAAAALAALGAAGEARAQAAGGGPPGADPDWPCVQRLVPALAPASVWQGPELPDAAALPAAAAAGGDAAGPALGRALARSTPEDAAAADVAALVAAAPAAERAALAAGLLDDLVARANAERGSMIRGIQNFARRQRALAGKINADTRRLRDLEEQGTGPARAEAAEIRERRAWDTRVYDDRQRTLVTACEQPVRVDRRVFALARAMAGALP